MALHQLSGCSWSRSLHAGSPKAQGLFSLLLGIVCFPLLRAVVQLATSVGFVEAATYDYENIKRGPREEAAGPVTRNLSGDPMVIDQGETPECEDITDLECAKRNAQRREILDGPSHWWAAQHKPGGAVQAPSSGTAAPDVQERLHADDVSDHAFVEDNAGWLPNRDTAGSPPLSVSRAPREHRLLDEDARDVADYDPNEGEKIPSIGNNARFPASFSATESTGQSHEDFSISERPRLDESRGELNSAEDHEGSQGEGAYWVPAGTLASADNRRAWGVEGGEELSTPLGPGEDTEGDYGSVAQAEEEREKRASRGTRGNPMGVKRPLNAAEDVRVARDVPWKGGAPQAVSGLPRSRLIDFKRRSRSKNQQDSPSRYRNFLRWVVPIASAAAVMAVAGYGGHKVLQARRQHRRT